MRVLLVGGGGREHALAWALSRDSRVQELVVAPGNPGIAEVGRCVAVAADDVDGLVALAKGMSLVVVGPEAPLVAGLADRLTALGIPVFGPSAAAARLEGSKGFLKDLCAQHGIPTAAYRRFTDADEASAFVREHGAPVVVKADGLAAGKGVTVAETVEEAITAVDDALREGRFGEAGRSVVIEDFLVGPEMSLFALCDGDTARFYATAMDYKRAGDGGTGPNTGGMGAITPHPLETPELIEQIMATIVRPTVEAMKAEGCPFRGVLYAGVMLTREGPMLLEYNARFGDPECQALMVAQGQGLLDAVLAVAGGAVPQTPRPPRPGSVACVVMTAPGYPDRPVIGDRISGIERARALGVEVFHAGTANDAAGVLRSSGGRVLNLVARAPTIDEAARKAYAAVAAIDWPRGRYRRDIGTWESS